MAMIQNKEIKQEIIENGIRNKYPVTEALLFVDVICSTLSVSYDKNIVGARDYIDFAIKIAKGKNANLHDCTGHDVSYARDRAKNKPTFYLMPEKDLNNLNVIKAMYEMVEAGGSQLWLVAVAGNHELLGVEPYRPAWMKLVNKENRFIELTPYKLFFSSIGEGFGRLEGKVEALTLVPDEAFLKRWKRNINYKKKTNGDKAEEAPRQGSE